jgi:hypothetical protein
VTTSELAELGDLDDMDLGIGEDGVAVGGRHFGLDHVSTAGSERHTGDLRIVDHRQSSAGVDVDSPLLLVTILVGAEEHPCPVRGVGDGAVHVREPARDLPGRTGRDGTDVEVPWRVDPGPARNRIQCLATCLRRRHERQLATVRAHRRELGVAIIIITIIGLVVDIV